MAWLITYTNIYYWNIQFLNNVPIRWLLGGWYLSLLIVKQQRDQPSDSNKNVDIEFNADDAFLEWFSQQKENVVANVCTKHMITRLKLDEQSNI